MKLTGARIESFLCKPDPVILAVLVYGPDQGLVRERADRLVATVAGVSSDAFRISELSAEQLKDDSSRLAAEAAALSFSGGRRVVRVRDARDAQTESVRRLLASGATGLAVLEAGELGPRSPLRQVAEAAPNAAALPCYADEGETLRSLIVSELAADGLTISDEAAELLTGLLGADRGITRSELTKLALYKGGSGPRSESAGESGRGVGEVDVDDVLAVIGAARQQSTDTVAYAACSGDFAGLDRALATLMAEGTQAISILRGAARHLQRLLQARALIDRGATPRQAVDRLKPPVHFRWRQPFERQVGVWTSKRLAVGLLQVTDAELQCKQTGVPQALICHRTLIRLAELAAPRRRQKSRGR